MGREIAKAYEPKQIEPRWADYWVKEKLFRADPAKPGPVFSIVIPPPNVTGSLHIGHMLDHTEIDILTRWHRMRGYNTLYLPGTDHAGISTQRVVVRQLAEQKINYRDLGREEFLQRVWKWKEESGGTIQRQMKQIGESCDWSREKFTLSPELSRVVNEVFVRLYEEGLIYRDFRLMNWCPVCLTVLSDLEVIHEERPGHLWHIRYPVAGSKEYLTVATTRPETMLGDTAVAVHPEDERYQHLLGKKVILPLMNREIPIIGDEMVDREFGTGAVKITPAHDPNDWEAGKRHGLEQIDVMTEDGHINANGGAYKGLERFAARKKIVEDLKEQGFLEKITEHVSAIGLCERSKTIVEPRASTQWFCKMKPLAEPAIEAVERGDIQIIPENRRQEFFHWMRNIRDWTISRQLWWGHRIPAWYCGDCQEVTVAREAPKKCAKCGAGELKQDPDVLDTWFSSGLWPFSTLGWPDDTEDFRYFYPTSLLETGYDILFFWVARMIMLGLEATGEVPFREVYLHGLIRVGREKMSKVKGNVLNPLDLIERYGTDALRLALVVGTTPGNDTQLNERKLEDSRNFVNKLWNSARYVLMNVPPEDRPAGAGTAGETAGAQQAALLQPPAHASLADRWIISRANYVAAEVTRLLHEYQLGEAARTVQDFLWSEYCDWYLEIAKIQLRGEDAAAQQATRETLGRVLGQTLRLLHPFAPFVTEELWQTLVGPNPPSPPSLPRNGGAGPGDYESSPLPASGGGIGRAPSIMVAAWPAPGPRDPEAERAVDDVVALITSVRNLRQEKGVEPKRFVPATLVGGARADLLRAQAGVIGGLARLQPVEVVEALAEPPKEALPLVAGGFEAYLPAAGLFDVAAERKRLQDQIAKTEQAVGRSENLLASPGFAQKAKPEVVQAERDKLAANREQLERLRGQLAALGA